MSNKITYGDQWLPTYGVICNRNLKFRNARLNEQSKPTVSLKNLINPRLSCSNTSFGKNSIWYPTMYIDLNHNNETGGYINSNGPIGPYLVTKDEIKDINNLNMSLDLNGKRMQTGNTSTMIFNVNFIVAYVSQYMSLQPGDIITTGTPPGVGMGMKPQLFLKAGDKLKLSIENLGEQNSTVVPL